MGNKNTLEQIINKQVLPKLVALLVIVSLIVLSVSYLTLKSNIEERHQQGLNNFQTSVEEKISLLKGEVTNLSSNELITNALIDFEARQEYLPIFFRSLRLTGADNASLILTDFEGVTITANNPDPFTNSNYSVDWQQSVLVDGKTVFDVSSKGVLLINPVFYADLPEGALIVYLPSLDSVFTSDFGKSSDAINYQIHDQDGSVLYRTNTGNSVSTESSSTYSVQTESSHLGLIYLSDQPFYAAYKQLLSLATLVLLTIAIVFFGSTYSNRLATQIASRSIAQLKDSIQAISSDVPTVKIEDTDPSEVEDLKHTYNHLSTELFATTQSLSEFEGVINSLNEFLVVLDEEQNHIICNETFKHFCDEIEISKRDSLDVDGVIQQVLPQELLVEDNVRVSKPSERVYRTREEVSFKIIKWRRHQFLSRSNDSRGWVYVGSDITETKAIQADLEMKNKAIDEAKTSVVISKFCPGSPIIYVNDAFTAMTGYTKEDSMGRNCSFLQGPETTPESIREISSAIAEKRSQTTTILNYKKDGTPFHNELTISPIKNELGEVTHVLGLQVDVSEAERLKTHLSEAKQKAEESSELKSSFLASMSHEIRTPLNGVIGMLNILSESSLDESQQRHTEIAQSSAKSLLFLINDILDLSKIEAGKIDLEYRQVDVMNLISEVAKPLGKLALEKNNQIIIDTRELDCQYATLDEARVKQILLNLLSNALKFTNEGDVTVAAKIYAEEAPLPHTHHKTYWLECSVSDSGIGIPNNRLDSIFDSFTQADSSTTRKFGGTGLGLSICKQLSAAMGGDISVISSEGIGSIFTFTIKLADERLDLSEPNTIEVQSEEDSKKAIILYHHEKISAILENSLQRLGFATVLASDLEDAFGILDSDQIDLLIFDQNFLNKRITRDDKSLGFLEQRERSPKTKTVLISRLDFDTTSFEGFSSVVDAHIESPITFQDLELAIDQAFKVSTTLPPKHTADPELHSQVPIRNYPVLLVEDNPVNQMVAKAMLDKFDLDVVIAENGEEALSKLKENESAEKPSRFQAIFMDCQMPIMDGYEATRRIRLGESGANNKNTTIIAMTANAIKGDREKCLEVGMNDYISKPIEPEVLKDIVDHWILNGGQKLSNHAQ